MKILALDTSTKSCSVAIVDDGSLSAEITTLKDQTHSKHLMELVDSALALAGFRVNDLDGLAVSIGPGSFTGLRIGISTIKGLAYAFNKPLVGISSLAALAWQCADRSLLICPLLDARKGEVYWATYRFENEKLIPITPAAAKSPAAAIRQINESCVFIGDGAQHYRSNILKLMGDRAHFAISSQNILRASSVAFLSIERFEANDTDKVSRLVPDYIRESDAELNF